MLTTALDYWRRGWCIIPIVPGTKKPPVKWKQYQTQRPDEAMVREWFSGAKAGALAVILGPVSVDLVCRDFDNMAAYDEWAARHPDLAIRLPTVATHRGRHVYATIDAAEIRRAGNGSTIIDVGDGELRGGGYCLLPASPHPEGAIYRWLVPLSDRVPAIDLRTSGFLPAHLSSEIGRPATEQRDCPREPREAGEAGEPIEPGECPPPSPDSLGHSEAIERAIAATLPADIGQRHRKLFQFARNLKAIPALAGADLATLRPIVRDWHHRALPAIATKPWEETWWDFCEGWGKVKYPAGTDPVTLLFQRAVAADVAKAAEQYDAPEVRLLVSFCRELQRTAGEGTFYLDSRTAARLILGDASEHATISRWLRGLIRDRILALVEAGENGRAARYRYVADLPAPF